MSALICGSFAFDNIMVFHDRFKNHILPDKVHILNVSFLVPEMRKEFGGCAGNIAYNLKLLGGHPVPMGTVGQDFLPYANWMEKCGISGRYVKVLSEHFTAQAFITTDLDDNQITAFHPGAMSFAHDNTVSEVSEKITHGMVCPDGRAGMIEHAAQFVDAGIPFIFDPGQGLPMFSGDELKTFIEQATWMSVNDYEFQLTKERTGWSEQQIAERLKALIVTKGGAGSVILADGKRIEVPAAKVTELQDPTGCGDAYRAGLLYGLQQGLDWETTGQIASLMGGIKIEAKGTQNHHFTMEQFRARFSENFGTALP